MAYRLSMAPRVVRRFGVHLRPHVIALVAHLARRVAWLCLAVGALVLVHPAQTGQVPVRSAGSSHAEAYGATPDGLVIDPPVPAGVEVRVPAGDRPAQLVLDAPTRLENSLAQGRATLTWLAVGAAAWWLAPLLRTFAAGDPFERGNPRRLRLIALAVLVATHVAPLLPPLAAHLALDRLGMAGFSPAWGSPLHTSVLFVALLLLLAGALRQGTTLQDDVAGLV